MGKIVEKLGGAGVFGASLMGTHVTIYITRAVLFFGCFSTIHALFVVMSCLYKILVMFAANKVQMMGQQPQIYSFMVHDTEILAKHTGICMASCKAWRNRVHS